MTPSVKKNLLKQQHIGVFSLTMLMSGAVDGISNLPSIALFGPILVFYFITAVLLFLIPVGFISAELCHQFPQNSGVYAWSKQALGPHTAALVIWLQWINTMVWFPTCLTTLAGTAAYFINPNLNHHPVYLVSASLLVFWSMTLINMKGIQYSTKISSFASSIGMLLPMVIIIGLCAYWILLGKPLSVHLNAKNLLPQTHHLHNLTSLTAIITAFLGLELATVHVKKIAHAKSTFPKALIMTLVIISITMGLGSLAVAVVIPHNKMILVSGTIQAFNTLLTGLHIQWLFNILVGLLILGTVGTMVNWLISPANGLAQAAKDHYLPKCFAKENAHQVPAHILIAQAVIVSLCCCAFFLMPSINGSYWLLLDLSTELYVMMYLLMFLSAFKLLCKVKSVTIIPGGKIAALILCVIGCTGCLITVFVGFIPPAQINTGSSHHFTALFGLSLLIMTLPAGLLICHKQRTHA
jgi:glutamate:GABA antiporter